MENLFLVLRVIVSLAVVLGLLYVLRRKLVPRAGGAGQRREIAVVARQGVGAKTSVALVDVGGKRYLLGVGEQSVNVLDSYAAPVPDEAEPAAHGDGGRLFALNLDDARHRTRRQPASLGSGAGTTSDTPEATPAADAQGAPLTRRDLRVDRLPVAASGTESASPLAGSILSAHTWRQAAAAWRRGSS